MGRVVFAIPEDKLFYIRDENTDFTEELSVHFSNLCGRLLPNE